MSFTFDDFPHSAATLGSAVLDEFGIRATYYTSIGLMGKTTAVGKMFVRDDLDALVEKGHELACHTYDHSRCVDLNRRDLIANCSTNRNLMGRLVEGYTLRNFSFPEGVVTLSAKTALGAVYETCRTIEPGLNDDPMDIWFLRANRLYSSSGVETVKRIVDSACDTGGWAIVYTHDISDRPSTWGCTPAELREAVAYAVQSGVEILPVAETMMRYTTAS